MTVDIKVSSVAASTTSLGRQFHSFPILDCSGQKGRAPVLCPCWDELELPVMTSVLVGGGGGGWDLRPGQWTRLLWILYSTESLAI